MKTLLALVAILFACSLLPLSYAQDSPVEPVIANASGDGQSQIAGFKIREGWKCELVAAEPMLANPVAFAVAPQGRIFVCESFRQNKGVTDNRSHDKQWINADLAALTVEDRIAYHRKLLGEDAKTYEQQVDRLRVLVDTNNDGIYDDSKVFFEGVHAIEDGTGAGVLARGDDVFYTCIPKLWRFRDTNHDLKADESTALYDGFGVRVAFRGHDMHGLIVGPDGRLYFSIGDRGYHVVTKNGTLADPESGAVFRCELDGSNLEVFATGLRNPQELAFDDYGNFFTCDNNSDSGDEARWTVVTQGGDSGWRMMYQYLPDRGPFNRESIWHPFNEGSPAYIVPPIANFSDGPSGLVAYPGTGLGSEYRGAFFLCDFRGQASNSGVRTAKPIPKGAFFELTEETEPIWSLLATDVDFDLDGSILVSDWVNGWNGEGKGRLYRFFDPEKSVLPEVTETAAILRKGMDSVDDSKLVMWLNHLDRRVRLESQWELAERDSFDALKQTAFDRNSPELSRVHAFWGLGQLARKGNHRDEAHTMVGDWLANQNENSSEVIVAALNAFSDSCFSAAAGTAETSKAAVAKLVLHDHPRVRCAAAMATGRMSLEGALPNVIAMLESNKDADPILRHAGIMAMAGVNNLESIASLSSHSSESVRLAAVVALRKRNSDRVADFLEDRSERVVLEAARAIHDVPALHGKLEALARKADLPSNSEPILHRVLNAGFRMGQPQHAVVLAKFAADAKRPESMRLEALAMLEAWENPGILDRVMNRYMPLAKRDPKPAADALDGVLTDLLAASGDVRSKARDVASKLGLQSVAPALISLVNDKNAPGNERAAALESLLRLKSPELAKLTAICVDDLSPAVRAAALRLLILFDEAAACDAAKKRVYSEVVTERQNAWDVVGKIKSAAATSIIEEGIIRYIEQRLPQDVWLNVKEAAQGRLGASIQTKLTEYESAIAAKAIENPTAAYQDCVVGGDPKAGKILFAERSQLSCVRCHEVDGEGGNVGPDLTTIAAKKNAEYLLEAIVAPNAKLAEGFETIIVQTDEGEIITGIVKERTADALIVTKPDGSNASIPTDSIEGTKKGLSSMPADLTKYLNRRELRDLVAYLASLDGKVTKGKNAKKPKGHRN